MKITVNKKMFLIRILLIYHTIKLGSAHLNSIQWVDQYSKK